MTSLWYGPRRQLRAWAARLIAAPVLLGMAAAAPAQNYPDRLDMELLFRTLAKVDITHVPYGPAQAVNAVVGNQVPIGSTSMPPAVPHVKAGCVRPIAVTTAKRSAILPDTPTVAESGFAGFDDHTWFSFFAPAGTPPAIVNKLTAEITRILQHPDTRSRLDVLSLEFTPNKPGEFAARLKKEVQRYEKMVRDSGAKAD